jgi:hypothetical protein
MDFKDMILKILLGLLDTFTYVFITLAIKFFLNDSLVRFYYTIILYNLPYFSDIRRQR